MSEEKRWANSEVAMMMGLVVLGAVLIVASFASIFIFSLDDEFPVEDSQNVSADGLSAEDMQWAYERTQEYNGFHDVFVLINDELARGVEMEGLEAHLALIDGSLFPLWMSDAARNACQTILEDSQSEQGKRLAPYVGNGNSYREALESCDAIIPLIDSIDEER